MGEDPKAPFHALVERAALQSISGIITGKEGGVAGRQTLAVRGYRDRLKRGGWVRCEVKVRRDDVELIRSVATALRDPDRHAATRALLRDRLGDPRPRGFKELLASCPVDLDLDRSRDLGRDIEI